MATTGSEGLVENEQNCQRERAEQRLRYQCLGRLAGGIAHDFNNLLTVISGHSEILQMRLSEDPAAAASTEKILQAVREAHVLCRQMLAFCGKANVRMEAVDINEMIAAVCSQLRQDLRDDVTLQTHLSLRPVIVPGDRELLWQLITNLVSNAADATASRGSRISVTLDLDDVRVTADDMLGDEDITDISNWICLTVNDDGSGIADEVRHQIFDPFFSTHESRRGLGLATALGITRAHRGAIRVDTRPGLTSFRVFLPREFRQPAV